MASKPKERVKVLKALKELKSEQLDKLLQAIVIREKQEEQAA